MPDDIAAQLKRECAVNARLQQSVDKLFEKWQAAKDAKLPRKLFESRRTQMKRDVADADEADIANALEDQDKREVRIEERALKKHQEGRKLDFDEFDVVTRAHGRRKGL